MIEDCPVCSSESDHFFLKETKGAGERAFRCCPTCSLVFQTAGTLPSAEEEHARYRLHRNDGEDEGYRNWLESFIEKSVIPWYGGGNILDFGSGPRPVLSDILKARGLPVYSYDPFFAPRLPVPSGGAFSLILLCEVLEHIQDPVTAFRMLFQKAAEGACLSLMTQFLPSHAPSDFRGWWYKEDPTHIRFYSDDSLRALGQASGWTLHRLDGQSRAVYKKGSP